MKVNKTPMYISLFLFGLWSGSVWEDVGRILPASKGPMTFWDALWLIVTMVLVWWLGAQSFTHDD